MNRRGRRSAHVSGPTASQIVTEQNVLSLAPFAWLRMDSYQITGAKASALVDKVQPGHLMSQSTDANRAAIPTSDSAGGWRASATFSAASPIWYDSNLPASSWAFLHSGAGAEWFATYAPTSAHATAGVLFDTGGTTTTGMCAYLSNSTRHILGRVAGPAMFDISPAGTYTLGVVECLHGTLSESASPDATLRVEGGTSATANSAVAFSGAAPSATLRIGANVSGTQGLTARLFEFLVFNRILSAAENAVVSAYRQTWFGAP